MPRQPPEIFTHALTTNQIAKNVFALHGVDAADRACLVRPSVRRDQLLEMVAKLPPCTIGMEASSGAHNWARHVGRCSKEGGSDQPLSDGIALVARILECRRGHRSQISHLPPQSNDLSPRDAGSDEETTTLHKNDVPAKVFPLTPKQH